MNEKLLQFIWQFQYYNKNGLVTVDGSPLHIIHPGFANTNQGPDFLEARIKTGDTEWAGNIEIHTHASHWNNHKHNGDTNYSNIILHVVWINDTPIKDGNNQLIATLELYDLVPKIMLQQYEQLIHAKGFVPCENYLPALTAMGWLSWKERLMAERLQRKSANVLLYLQQAGNHWEEVFWWLLARNFGMKVNAGIFEQVAKSIPVNILAKHKNQVNQLEALLLGQAGLLSGSFMEEYPQMLQREYRFLAAKFKLQPIAKKPDFLRMRPANFPTVRLAQLAMLVHCSTHLFSGVLEMENISDLRKLLDITANDYWLYHYIFDEETACKPKNIGRLMVDNIIINTVIPVLFAYGIYHKEQRWKDKALQYAALLPAEQNAITKQWGNKNISNENALDSQALLELKNNYCDLKYCLNCAVGNKVLKAQE
ncbi:MAG TPA: DUF2851 family protein [Panacibacter sp.]|nr:DUF2851 family protein [Panacibacter sp.]